MHQRLSRWWSSISLRTKVTGVTVLLVTFGLLVVGTGTISVLRAYLVDEVDKKLSESVEQFRLRADFVQTEQGLDCTTTSGLTEQYYTAIVTPDGDVLCDNRADDQSAPDVAAIDLSVITAQAGRPFSLGNGEGGGGQWRVIALPITPVGESDYYPFVVGMNLNETNSIIAQFTAIFFFFGVNVVILAAALTRLMVTTTFAPLRDVEQTAARFADGDFTQRLTGAAPNTEVGRLNQSLNAMLSRIDSAFKDRAKTIDQMRRFVGDASHELRTPLVSVRGYAELYRMGALQNPDDVAQAMERIEKEAVRMGELVEDMLELARLDEARPLQLAPVDLVPIAQDAAMDTMASSPERTVSVVVYEPIIGTFEAPDAATAGSADGPPPPAPASNSPKAFAGATLARLRNLRNRPVKVTANAVSAPVATAGDTGAVVWAEENKVRQVVTNLIGNAMRFTTADSPIEIGIQVDHARGLGIISVIDHGEGIPPQIREKIFQRFWRADSSRTRDTGGSGLGLAIVSSIVANLHGAVDVVETPGGGATFRVALPLHRPEPSTAEAAAS
ncbi:HAMP domain-containing sensor histidine kinase [Salinibacterium sp. ZJ454]|uniref:sensor histidine kinase n=1 Tax=Salinibacterium sp. ZJ454 TaxID=2708339 RepID=UPI0014203C23|nr:HAMP domain-containing sensor histidine kinase [Salinibacterium sp. ZJ454]